MNPPFFGPSNPSESGQPSVATAAPGASLAPPPRRAAARLWVTILMWLTRLVLHPILLVGGNIFLWSALRPFSLFSILVFLFLVFWNYSLIKMFPPLWIAPARTRRIYSHGQVTAGVIIKKLEDESYGVIYEYEDANGCKHSNEEWNVRYGLWKKLQIGQRVPVLYLPETPEKSAYYHGANEYLIK